MGIIPGKVEAVKAVPVPEGSYVYWTKGCSQELETAVKPSEC